MEFLGSIIDLGSLGVTIAQVITSLIPASWWASGILAAIEVLIQSIGGTQFIDYESVLDAILAALGG